MRCYQMHYLLLTLHSATHPPDSYLVHIFTLNIAKDIRAMLPVVIVRAVTLAFALAATWMAKVQYDRLAVGLLPCHLTFESCVFPLPYPAKAAQEQRPLVTKLGQNADSYDGPVDPKLAIINISEVYDEEKDEVLPDSADGKFTLRSFIESRLESFCSLGEMLWFVGTLVAPWLMCTGAAWYLQQRKIWDLRSVAIIADARLIRLQQRYEGLKNQAGIPQADSEGRQSSFSVENLRLKERVSENHFDPLDEEVRDEDESPEANRAIMRSPIFRHTAEDLRMERARAYSMAQKVTQLIEALEILQARESEQDQYYEVATQ
ncbi:hypothetical protein N7G274_006804 [Stereocaulon virgatum]|uniref:Uncharacterized protein n=1 Tax=Stereocaulon virgatum TaxID=373712 RepID=A0ABR4A4T8_9LECA